MTTSTVPVGKLLREWRNRRRISQLDLALEAGISSRHLSFVETGRARPSREMVLKIAQQLEVPVRERNVLLTAAGFAPHFPERSLNDNTLALGRAVIDMMLERHKPYPAFAIDRHWQIIATNNALPALYEEVAPELLAPPVNAMRLSLHPGGLAPAIVNLAEWRAHLLFRLKHQIELTADSVLITLLDELKSYSRAAALSPTPRFEDNVAVPLKINTEVGPLSFISTTTVFGTPVDVTLSELAVELFFPADNETTMRVHMLDLARKDPLR